MYRAKFAFASRDAGVLPCVAGDRFTVIDSSDEQWLLVMNGKGQVGYVPANYLVVDDVRRMINYFCIDYYYYYYYYYDSVRYYY